MRVASRHAPPLLAASAASATTASAAAAAASTAVAAAAAAVAVRARPAAAAAAASRACSSPAAPTPMADAAASAATAAAAVAAAVAAAAATAVTASTEATLSAAPSPTVPAPAAPAAPAPVTLETLTWDNRSLRELPLDSEAENYVRTVRGAIFSRVTPTPVAAPTLVAVSLDALGLLELGTDQVARPDFVTYFSGNAVLPGAEPAAHCYCGHQFGSFAGQLGDGATMYLGEVVTRSGSRLELQFKGAGKTPYSRTADGRKVLRSSLREFLCSEAMWALGVPTTRAATVVTSDTKVQRDVHYTGDVIDERATVITRLAPTFLRFGSFEVFKPTDPHSGRTGPSVGNLPLLRTLADFTVRHYYPAVAAAHADDAAARAAGLLEEVTRRTARLAAMWQAYGWCHGVLNTDNMSMVGVTLDYGPFGWMDRTDDDYVCNASDTSGRYSYHNQPHAVRWNVTKLGEALAPLLPPAADAKAAVKVYDREFRWAYEELLRRKLGLPRRAGATPTGAPSTPAVLGTLPYLSAAAVVAAAPAVATLDAAADGGVREATTASPLAPDDVELVKDLRAVMQDSGADYTNTFRALAGVTSDAAGVGAAKVDAASDADAAPDAVLDAICAQLASAAEVADMFAPRMPAAQLQHLLMLAQRDARFAGHLDELEAEAERHRRYAALRTRSDADKAASDRLAWRQWLARYRRRLAADDAATAAAVAARRDDMALANPKYVLRNWLAQAAITKAEAGDFSDVAALAARLRDPYGLGDVAGGAAAASDAAMTSVTAGGGCGGSSAGGGGSPTCGGATIAGATDYCGRPPSWARDLRVT